MEGLPTPTGLDMARCIATARITMPKSVVRLSAGRLELSVSDQVSHATDFLLIGSWDEREHALSKLNCLKSSFDSETSFLVEKTVVCPLWCWEVLSAWHRTHFLLNIVAKATALKDHNLSIQHSYCKKRCIQDISLSKMFPYMIVRLLAHVLREVHCDFSILSCQKPCYAYNYSASYPLWSQPMKLKCGRLSAFWLEPTASSPETSFWRLQTMTRTKMTRCLSSWAWGGVQHFCRTRGVPRPQMDPLPFQRSCRLQLLLQPSEVPVLCEQCRWTCIANESSAVRNVTHGTSTYLYTSWKS